MNALIRDIETRSEVDLPDVGPFCYARHPSTEVLYVSYAVNGDPVMLWYPGMPVPPAYKQAKRERWEVVAHNAIFEDQIERCILAPKFGFPTFPVEQQVCTMATAQALALPAALEDVAHVLKLKHQKDKDGHKAMLQVSKPRRARKDEDPNVVHWYDDEARMARTAAYCCKDTESERELFYALPPLIPQERELWLLDQKVNRTGFYVDRKLAKAALEIIEQAKPIINAEMAKLTGGVVERFTLVAKLKEWLAAQGYEFESLGKDLIAELLKNPELPDNIQRVLTLRLLGAQAATNKVQALLDRAEADDRVRGAFMFHAAGTGRWCVDADTLIDTPDGSCRIIDLFSGDLVIGGSRRPRKVLTKLYKGRELMYELSGPDAFVVATAGHRIMTEQGWKRIDDCFQEETKGHFVLRRGCTPISNTTSHYGRDCQETRMQLANVEQGSSADDTTGRIQTTEASGLLTQQEWTQESDVRCTSSRSARSIERSSSEVEWQGLYIRASSHIDESTGDVGVAKRLGSTSHQRKQNRQFPEQSSDRNQARASVFTQEETWSLIPVGERDVWDISVERDESYIAQGLIHHNSSHGVQVHNLKKPKTKDITRALKVIESGNYLRMLEHYDNPMLVIGDCIRSMIMAPPGHTLYGADFSGIEARVTAWVAGETSKLEVFRKFDRTQDPLDDPYVVAAAKIFRLEPKDIDKFKRDIGKACELAFGFQGGVNAFRRFQPAGAIPTQVPAHDHWVKRHGKFDTTANKEAMAEFNKLFTDPEIDEIKRKWRAAHPNIERFWHAINKAALEAIRKPGTVMGCGSYIAVEYIAEAPLLWITLPSGRRITYPNIKLAKSDTGWGTDAKFMDNSAGQWRQVTIYGGLLTENIVQGIARDLLAEAMLSIDAAGYKIVAHIHDECVIEVPLNSDLEKFNKLMMMVPAWAEGLPICVKAWESQRYVKA